MRLLCTQDVFRYALSEISLMSRYDGLIEDVMSPPRPSLEWLASLRAGGTDLPDDAETFDLELRASYPARKQSRTAVQMLLSVPRDLAPGRQFENDWFHSFAVVGEVLRDGRLFESFRYRFEGLTPPDSNEVPIGFTRFLRPGTVELRLLVRDVFGDQYAQIVEELDIPSPEGRPAVAEPSMTEESTEGPSLRLMNPGAVLSGVVRFETRAVGDFDKVVFSGR